MKQKHTFYRRKLTKKIAEVSPSNNNYSFRIINHSTQQHTTTTTTTTITSVAILAQVRRLPHGIFGGLGGVVASHLLEASRSPDLFGQEFVCCFGMSPAGDNFSVGMFRFVPSQLVYPQFDDLGNSPENSLVQPDGYNLFVSEFKCVPSLLTCPNPVDLMVHFLDMMMPAALVVVSLFLLVRVCGSAPSLLPWRAGNCGGFACLSVLGSTQSIWRIKGKGKKERNCFYGSSAFCFSHASFSAVASAMMVPLVLSAAPDVAAAFVYLFSDAFVRGFASVFFLTLGVAFDIRSSVAATLFFFKQKSAAATWCAALWAAALVYKFSDAFVHGFALVVSLALGEACVIWFAAAASLFCCEQSMAAAPV